jgi:alcohol dehydrogenase class IV
MKTSAQAATHVASPFDISLPPKIVVGGGTRSEIPRLIHAEHASSVLVVTDPFIRDHGSVTQIVATLRDNGLRVGVYGDVQPDPTDENVQAGLRACSDAGADLVLAVGGGSALDAGKAIAVMAKNPGRIADYAGYHQIPNSGLPMIAVPTTAGTGSEATRVTVITAEGRKLMVLDDHLLPRAAVVDFELTRTCPPALTAHVGVDSLTHAIEAYVSSRANPVTDAWAIEAARLIAAHLRRAFADPEDRDARQALALGALLGGMAFSNASVALVHGMSRPIGATFHLPHGLSNAVLLPSVTRFSVVAAPTRYAALARAVGAAGDGMADAEAAAALVDFLQRINEDLGVPRLRALGVTREALDAAKADMAQAALDSGSPGFNPRSASRDEIVGLYDEVF